MDFRQAPNAPGPLADRRCSGKFAAVARAPLFLDGAGAAPIQSAAMHAALPHLALPVAILLPLVFGTALALVTGRLSRALCAWTVAAVTAASFALVLTQVPAVLRGETVHAFYYWIPEIGLNLSFRLDGLALLFAGLILGIGLLVILYAAYYLGEDDPAGKFFSTMMLFMAAMLGIALSDNLLLLVVFWELTSVSSFLLIGYWSHRADARAGARMALAITGGGGLAMLAGFLLLGHIAGSFEISHVLTRGDVIHEHPLYPVALVLILLGAFTKSAQFPFHFWLPEAMAAPTPVSAYLHSATMVKAGVFLLARLYPAIGESPLFAYIVAITGLVTLVFAAYVAVFKHDLKGLLAYSTISHLGLIVFLLGLDSPLSAVAAVFHIVNHATFKASLFMAAGIIDHETGSRDMRRLNGLWAFMPHTATLAMVAAASMAGVPLFNGFLSKEMFFAEALEARELGALAVIVPVAATLGGVFSVAYSLRFIHDVFFNGQPVDLPRTPHEPPRFMKVPVELLVVVCVVVGIAPAATVGGLVQLAAGAVLGEAPPEYTLAIWHGFNLPLAMSAIAVAGGLAMYWLLQRKYNLHLHTPSGWTLRLLFQKSMDALFRFAGRVTAWTENGSLQRYAAWIVGSAIVLGAAPFLGRDIGLTGTRTLLAPTPVAVAVWLLLAAAVIGLVGLHRHRVTAVILVGAIGLVTALTFAYFSAPDLALTQISVEVVSTALLLMGLALLPQRTPAESSSRRKLRDAALAGAGGLGMAALAWAAMTREFDSIAWYFVEKSIPEGGGTNAVNVILVDFRGFDTFGEITVLGIAAIGVWALMDGMRAERLAFDEHGRRFGRGGYPLLFRAAARILLPLGLAVAAFVFLRGHNLPGGGFIAGLVASVALLMQYMALGQARAESKLRTDFSRWIGAGLGIAGLTGLGAWLFGRPFLTSAYGHPAVPILGEIPLASAALFDLGVFLVVVGATLLTLSALGNATRHGPDSGRERALPAGARPGEAG
jgi:multicomponent K+:H+ antiporter subunit A